MKQPVSRRAEKGVIPMKKIAAMTTTVAVTTAITVPAFAGGITAEQAKEIAIRHACVDPASVNYMTIHQDWDDGRQEYDVSFFVGRTEYSCDVDMHTDAVNDFEMDYADYD